jgi:hypothetical protein
VIPDLGHLGAANLLIRKRGVDAELEAARLQDLMPTAAMTTRTGARGRGSGGRSRRYRRRLPAGQISEAHWRGLDPGRGSFPTLRLLDSATPFMSPCVPTTGRRKR